MTTKFFCNPETSPLTLVHRLMTVSSRKFSVRLVRYAVFSTFQTTVGFSFHVCTVRFGRRQTPQDVNHDDFATVRR